MSDELLRLYNLLLIELQANSPVLSGNMKSGINLLNVGENEITIVIDAPFYDMEKWRKTKQIQHTGKIVDGKTDYASIVNDIGAFGRANRSTHWVNKCCVSVADVVANEIKAQVVKDIATD